MKSHQGIGVFDKVLEAAGNLTLDEQEALVEIVKRRVARQRRGYSYSPRRTPILQSDPTGASDKLPELLKDAQHRTLKSEEARLLAAALRNHEPWLEWAGKREAEAKGFTFDPVALHIHERVSVKAILKIAAPDLGMRPGTIRCSSREVLDPHA